MIRRLGRAGKSLSAEHKAKISATALMNRRKDNEKMCRDIEHTSVCSYEFCPNKNIKNKNE